MKCNLEDALFILYPHILNFDRRENKFGDKMCYEVSSLNLFAFVAIFAPHLTMKLDIRSVFVLPMTSPTSTFQPSPDFCSLLSA